MLLVPTLLVALGCTLPAVTRDPVDPEAMAEALAANQARSPVAWASQHAYLHYLQALLAIEREDWATAESELRQGLLHDRDAPEIRLRLGEVQWHLGREKAALAQVRVVLASRPEHTGARRLQARMALAQGSLEAAEEALRSVVRVEPTDRRAVQDLIRVLLERGRVGEAFAVVSAQAARLGEAGPWVRLARDLDDRGRPGPAVHAWSQAADSGPADPWIREGLARACEATGRWRCAREAYEAALQLAPAPRPALHLRIAALHRAEGDLVGASAAERRAVEAAPGDPQVRVEAALAAHARGDREGALRRLDEAIVLDPDRPRVRFLRGVFLAELDRLDEAAMAFSQVTPDDPHRLDAHLYLGSIRSRQARHEEALALLRAARAEAPDRTEPVVRLARAWQAAGQPAAALALLDEALANRPDDPDLLELDAELQLAGGRAEAALSRLRAAVARRPEDLSLRYALGVALERLGRVDAALEAMGGILADEPDHAAALNFVGYTWAEQGVRLEEAERYVRRALVQRPDDGFILDSLGWVLLARGRLEEAITVLERAAARAHDEPVVLGHLGEAYLRAGRRDDALRKWRRALELLAQRPDPSVRADIEARLQGASR